jgi:guanylate kinase
LRAESDDHLVSYIRVCPDQFLDPLKHTSRKPVPDIETDGEDAHFVNAERITADLENGKFFHFEQDLNGVMNAISFRAVDEVIAQAKVPILVLPVDSVISPIC